MTELSKKCLMCPTVFTKKKTEGMPRWKLRKFCSVKCRIKYMYANKLGHYKY